MGNGNWTDERVEQLKSMWNEGLSGGDIARALGGITRNAVIGKVHRLGLASHVTPNRAARPRVSLKGIRQPPYVPPAPVVEEDPLVLENGNHATVETISDRMCRWPIGHPSDANFHFCGRSPKTASPYCEAHARKAYQPHQEPRRHRKHYTSV